MFVILTNGDGELILFKACPRCGGDVDASYKEDIFCVQCAFRPRLTYSGPVLVDGNEEGEKAVTLVKGNPTPVGCPRCALEEVIPLEKLRPHYNTCYRCRLCGHIFSPGYPDPQPKSGVDSQ